MHICSRLESCGANQPLNEPKCRLHVAQWPALAHFAPANFAFEAIGAASRKDASEPAADMSSPTRQ